MERAINPYNFVPFYGDSFDLPPERKALDEIYENPNELVTGWLDIKLYTKTPLIIPDSAHYTEKTVSDNKDNQREHKVYRFFRLADEDNCVIPGSEIRGMLRSMYEAASNSCFPFFQKKPEDPISQRTPIYGAFRKRGLLGYDKDKRQWTLYGAKVHIINTDRDSVESGVFQSNGHDYKTGDKVDFSVSKGKPHLGSGPLTGYIQFNIPVNKKQPYHVAILEPSTAKATATSDVPHSWNPGDNSAYDSLYGSVFESANNAKKGDKRITTMDDLKRALEGVKDGNGELVPVYYFCVKRNGQPLYYLSGAAVGRVHQKRTWEEIMAEHSTCTSLSSLCPACALFGITLKTGGTKGRLRFTDAVITPECKPKHDDNIKLPILSSPKHSSFEFYLRKPDPAATYWNYDYYGVKKMLPNKPGKLVTEYHDLPRATPRGRKFYWHSRPATSNEKESHLNATMETVDDAIFQFRIYYDRITEAQLNEILWVITLGENYSDSKYWHKLGHAKPLGYGSVKLVVTSCTKRVLKGTLSNEGNFSVQLESDVPSKTMDCPFPENKTLESIRRMCNSKSTDGFLVEYLTGVARKNDTIEENIFTWFQYNRANSNSVITLVEPWDDDLTMETKRPKNSYNKRDSQNAKRKSGSGRSTSYKRTELDEKTFNSEAMKFPKGSVMKGKIKHISKGRDAFIDLDESICECYSFLGDNHNYEEGARIKVTIIGHDWNRKTFRGKPIL